LTKMALCDRNSSISNGQLSGTSRIGALVEFAILSRPHSLSKDGLTAVQSEISIQFRVKIYMHLRTGEPPADNSSLSPKMLRANHASSLLFFRLTGK